MIKTKLLPYGIEITLNGSTRLFKIKNLSETFINMYGINYLLNDNFNKAIYYEDKIEDNCKKMSWKILKHKLNKDRLHKTDIIKLFYSKEDSL